MMFALLYVWFIYFERRMRKEKKEKERKKVLVIGIRGRG